MPRGDEIEADESRRRRRSACSEDDNRDERYDRDDDDDYGHLRRKRPRQRSGLVLAAGIVTIVVASGYLTCGLFSGVCGACIAAFVPAMQPMLAQAAAQGNPQAPQAARDLQRAQTAGWVAIAEGVLSLGIGMVLLVGGICVLRRSNWARFVVIGIAGVAVVAKLIEIVVELILGLFDHPGDAAFGVVGLFVMIGYAGFVVTALLLPASSKDFAA